MAAGIQSHADGESHLERCRTPAIAVCSSSPGRSVFLEAGNTDGWIAIDRTVPVVD